MAEVATAFVQHYYSIFDTTNEGRQGLASLYKDESMLTFEQDQFQGTQSIIGKLSALSFTSVKHEVQTIDVQPTPGNGLLVFVTGSLRVDGDNLVKFSQCFNLLPQDGGSYYVLNDMFRLNYA